MIRKEKRKREARERKEIFLSSTCCCSDEINRLNKNNVILVVISYSKCCRDKKIKQGCIQRCTMTSLSDSSRLCCFWCGWTLKGNQFKQLYSYNYKLDGAFNCNDVHRMPFERCKMQNKYLKTSNSMSASNLVKMINNLLFRCCSWEYSSKSY